MSAEMPDFSGCRAALYIRLSKEDESEGPSQSVVNQKALLDGFAREHGIRVYDTYIDDGWSGTSFDRPAFNRMTADIEAKNVNLVITKDLSRLGRDYIMTGHYMERYFPEHRVRYISLLDGIDTGIESSANDITPFRAIMNDMYARDISKKIRSVKHDKQKKGLFIGGKPVYGYKMHPTEKNRIVVDEKAAAVVRRIFFMAAEGTSCRRIAAQLNEEQIPTPAVYCGWSIGRSGAYTGLWSGERISDMLRNETYIGSMVQGRQVRISYKSKKCLHQQRESWVVVENTHEPIVDAETFHRAGLMLESRRRTRSRTYDFLLKGLVFCHECGYPLAVLNRPNAKGEDVLYFVCRTYQRFTKSGECTSHCIREKTLTEAVLARVGEVCGKYLMPEPLLPEAERAVSRAETRRTDEPSALRGSITRLTRELDRVYSDRLSGMLPDADAQRILSRITGERTQLEARLYELERRRDAPDGQPSRAEELTRRFIQTAPASRGLLVSLIERIELTKDRELIIKFRFPEEGG